ncbi:MAG: hypothetical protein WAW85_14500 [Gordonia sp. (in: high G+C Gram-positive bacteria)]|uniref:hypothetical protein n=1 Tax=Gordonia sp. (in: high G+C Gram-positive bacteria) TaxID=84139 RepID=UPI003BB65AB8
MLGVILFVIGVVGLLLTLLSLVGADVGSVDFDLGDTGVGFASLLTPFLTGFGLLAGGLMVFGDVPTAGALLIGAVVGLVLAVVSALLIRWLWHSSEELPEVQILGSSARVVEAAAPGRYGTAEVSTSLGGRQITITGDAGFAHNDRVRVVAKDDNLNAYVVEQLPFSDLDD